MHSSVLGGCLCEVAVPRASGVSPRCHQALEPRPWLSARVHPRTLEPCPRQPHGLALDHMPPPPPPAAEGSPCVPGLHRAALTSTCRALHDLAWASSSSHTHPPHGHRCPIELNPGSGAHTSPCSYSCPRLLLAV